MEDTLLGDKLKALNLSFNDKPIELPKNKRDIKKHVQKKVFQAKKIIEHPFDEIFHKLEEHEKYRTTYLYYLQYINAALIDCMYDFFMKRQSSKVSTTLFNNQNIDIANNGNNPTRKVRFSIILFILKKFHTPNQKPITPNKLNEFSTKFKNKDLDVYSSEMNTILYNLPLELSKKFVDYFNERFFIKCNIKEIVTIFNILRKKRHYIDHYPQNEKLQNEIDIFYKIFYFLQPQQRTHFFDFIFSRLKNEKINLHKISEICYTIEDKLKLVKNINREQREFYNSIKDKKDKATVMKQAKQGDSKSYGLLKVMKNNRKDKDNKKYNELKAIQEQLFEPYEDKKRWATIKNLYHTIGMHNIDTIILLFTKAGIRPGFNDIKDLYDFSLLANEILFGYFIQVKETLVKSNSVTNDNFSHLIKTQPLYNSNKELFNKLISIRKANAHNKLCFYYPKEDNNDYFNFYEIAITIGNSLKVLGKANRAKEIAERLIALGKTYNHCIVYDIFEHKPIEKITIWTTEKLEKYGKDNINKNKYIVHRKPNLNKLLKIYLIELKNLLKIK